MSTYSIPELMRLWRKGDLTAEQAVGYILQHLEEWFQWRTELEKQLRQPNQPPSKPRA